MGQYRADEFLKEVLNHIKFPFDRDEIILELKNHILDSQDYYMGKGHTAEEAEELAVEQMGDPTEIGKELNKEHNPIIGWIWKVTNIIVVPLYVIGILILSYMVITIPYNLFYSDLSREIPKESIVYEMDLNNKVQIDDRVIHFKKLIYDEKNNLHIFYKYYDKKFWKTGWGLGSIGTVTDNLGSEYLSGSGTSSGGIITNSRRTIRDFSPQANTLIIDFDSYNRSYNLQIPLKVGDNYE